MTQAQANWNFRSAVAEDAQDLARILKHWIMHTDWMPKLHTDAEDLRFLTKLICDHEVTVFQDTFGLFGFMARDQHIIHALYLHVNARGRGVGKALLDLAKSRSDRLELWTFQQNQGARRFYRRERFREVEYTDGAGNDEHLPDVRLIWERGA